MAEISFCSALKEQFNEFVLYKKASLRWSITSENNLKAFDRFCASYFPNEKRLTEDMMKWCWERDTEHGNSCSFRINVVREFVKFARKMKWTDLDIPPNPPYQQRKYIPHFFTEKEIRKFFIECDKWVIEVQSCCKTKAMVRTLTVPVMFRLLFSTGMRTNEVRLLKCSDIDFRNGIININDSKGNDRHRVALHQSMLDLLVQYDNAMSLYMPEREYFFPNEDGKPRQAQWFTRVFRMIWPKVNNKENAVPYDLRHNYAIDNISRWEEDGYGITDKLIYLGRTMGHLKFSSTLYYFHITPRFANKVITNGQMLYDQLFDD